LKKVVEDPPAKAPLESLPLQILELLALSGSLMIKRHENVALNQPIPKTRQVKTYHISSFMAFSSIPRAVFSGRRLVTYPL